MTEDNPKERPTGGQWVEQQKKGMKKQAEAEPKRTSNGRRTGAAQQQDQGKVTEHSVSGPAGKEVRAGWFGESQAG